jgi:hypothetical protein
MIILLIVSAACVFLGCATAGEYVEGIEDEQD